MIKVAGEKNKKYSKWGNIRSILLLLLLLKITLEILDIATGLEKEIKSDR